MDLSFIFQRNFSVVVDTALDLESRGSPELAFLYLVDHYDLNISELQSHLESLYYAWA